MKDAISMFGMAAVFYTGFSLTAIAQKQGHVIQALDEAKWGTAPPMLYGQGPVEFK